VWGGSAVIVLTLFVLAAWALGDDVWLAAAIGAIVAAVITVRAILDAGHAVDVLAHTSHPERAAR
jgi:hypothetical protein